MVTDYEDDDGGDDADDEITHQMRGRGGHERGGLPQPIEAVVLVHVLVVVHMLMVVVGSCLSGRA